jgi:hypothetical protein
MFAVEIYAAFDGSLSSKARRRRTAQTADEEAAAANPESDEAVLIAFPKRSIAGRQARNLFDRRS